METTEGYRKARGKNAIVCSIAIAWGSAQIDIGSFSFGGVSSKIVNSGSIALGLFLLLFYFGARTSLEYAMQPVEVRRWNLAQIDFKIGLNLFRVAFFILAMSTVSRNEITATNAIIGLGTFALAFALIFCIVVLVFSVIYIPIRTGYFDKPVASSAFRAIEYSLFITVLVIALLIVDQVLPNNLLPYTPNFLPEIESPIHLAFFIAVLFLLFGSFIRSDILLNPIFAFVPKWIGTHYSENGVNYYTEGLNPAHPDYEELKRSTSITEPHPSMKPLDENIGDTQTN